MILNKSLAGFAVLSFLLILLGMNRGFDISDEGMYALLSVPDQENLAGVFNYDLFFKLLYKITGIEFGLIGLRFLRLLTCLVGSMALMVFWNNFFQRTEQRTFIFLISLLGIFGSYGFLSQTLSYNSINLMCGCIWLGLISCRQPRNSTIFLLGITLSLLFYSKITVSLILSVLTVGFILWKSDWTTGAKKLALLCLPFLLFESVFSFVLGESGISRAFAAQEMLNYRPDYNFWILIKYTCVGAFWSLIVITPFTIAGYLKSRSNSNYRFAIAIGFICLIIITYITTITNEVNHFLLLCTLAIMGFLLGSLKGSEISRYQMIFLALLIAFPFILHFGSNVYFLRLGIHYWVFWILASMSMVRQEYAERNMLSQLMIPLISFILVANGLSLYAFDNYNYFEKTVTWKYREDKYIQLPLKQAVLYHGLKDDLNVSTNTLEVLPIFRNPGLVYILGTTHPKTPGLWSMQQLKFFFPTSKNLSVILYNNTFEFPFDRRNWQEGGTFEFSEDEHVKVFWKK